VAALQSPAVLRDAAQWRKAAGEFVGLLDPAVVRRMSAAAHLVVLPHEMLWRVPFEALPIEDGYLGDRTRVSYTGSIAALVRGEGIAASPADTMLAVGAPDVSDQVRERLKQTAPGWTIRSPEAVDRELQAVVPPERGRVLSGQAATEPALRADVSSAAIVHVAAPFRINGASPLFSPILLAGDRTGADAAQDGALEAREIVNLELRAGLAVLSDGAAISMRDGAGAIDAVQWAWLAAGVPALVLARWPADAEAGNALLAELHRRLRDGATPREALHAAREAVRRRPQTAAPVHWAGWMLIAAR
jgi:CHAT domain-containing protein